MTGIDAALLYMETPTAHMHTIKVVIFEPENGAGGSSFAEAKERMRERLGRLFPLRRRVVDVPFGIHHPVWIEDPDFDLDNHVHRAHVPAPGGPQQMDEVVSRIASQPLNRSRPLWEIWFMEGLEGGRFGAIAKMHHAVADGVAAAALLDRALGGVSADDVASETSTFSKPEPMPTSIRLLREALRDRLRQLVGLPPLLLRTVSHWLLAARHRHRLTLLPPRPSRDTPKVMFCSALTSRRVFVSSELPLADFKEVKNVFGVKLNDVVLAVVAGSVRSYLEARDALPERPLVTEVPISIDPPAGPPRISGNHISSMSTSLRTDIDEPIARLRAIHEITKIAKELHNDRGSSTIEDWLEYAPPRPFEWFMRLYSRCHLADRLAPGYNVIVSSVPGPRAELRWENAPLRALYSVGPILEGVGFNVTMWSYGDRLSVGMIACPENLPEPREIVDGLRTELAELLAVARQDVSNAETMGAAR